jgi:hypothetical protein
MHDLMSKVGRKHMRVGRWIAIAVDGSKETAPRTACNETALRAKNYGQGKNAKNRKRKRPTNKKKQTKTKIKQAKTDRLAKPKTVSLPPPQVWVTMMWHMGLGLPWCWKLGPSNASERNQVKEMLEIGHFFADTLFVGDAGFVGYDFWRAITDRGHHFMVRVARKRESINWAMYSTSRWKGNCLLLAAHNHECERRTITFAISEMQNR